MPMLRLSPIVPRLCTILVVVAGTALLATPLRAADLPGPDDIVAPSLTAAPSPTPAGDGGASAGDAGAADAALEAERAAVQAFGSKNPACLAWGDGCVTCQKGDDGKTVCANPGPTCLPRETACTRVRDVPADPTPKDAAPKDTSKDTAPAAPPAPAPSKP